MYAFLPLKVEAGQLAHVALPVARAGPARGAVVPGLLAGLGFRL